MCTSLLCLSTLHSGVCGLGIPYYLPAAACPGARYAVRGCGGPGSLSPLSHYSLSLSYTQYSSFTIIINTHHPTMREPPCACNANDAQPNHENKCCPAAKRFEVWLARGRLRLSQGRTLLTVHTEFHLGAHLHCSRRCVRIGRLRRRRHLPRRACDPFSSTGGRGRAAPAAAQSKREGRGGRGEAFGLRRACFWLRASSAASRLSVPSSMKR
jgi:hypothetical protein